MLQILEMKFRISGVSSEHNEVTISFQKLEATNGERVFGITSYESVSLKYDTATQIILTPDRKFSLMNGKEFILPVGELFAFGNNKELLDQQVEACFIDKEREINLPKGMSQEVMKFVFALHEQHAEQACINLIDRALADEDIELFERMTNMIKSFS